MAKRKRVEAWATVHTDGTVDVDTKYLVPGPWCEAKCRGPIHLTESRPEDRAAAAVVRAAVAYVERERRGVEHDRWVPLLRAVEKYLKAKKGAK